MRAFGRDVLFQIVNAVGAAKRCGIERESTPRLHFTADVQRRRNSVGIECSYCADEGAWRPVSAALIMEPPALGIHEMTARKPETLGDALEVFTGDDRSTSVEFVRGLKLQL